MCQPGFHIQILESSDLILYPMSVLMTLLDQCKSVTDSLYLVDIILNIEESLSQVAPVTAVCSCQDTCKVGIYTNTKGK